MIVPHAFRLWNSTFTPSTPRGVHFLVFNIECNMPPRGSCFKTLCTPCTNSHSLLIDLFLFLKASFHSNSVLWLENEMFIEENKLQKLNLIHTNLSHLEFMSTTQVSCLFLDVSLFSDPNDSSYLAFKMVNQSHLPHPTKSFLQLISCLESVKIAFFIWKRIASLGEHGLAHQRGTIREKRVCERAALGRSTFLISSCSICWNDKVQP